MGDEKSTTSSKPSKPDSVLNFVMVTILIACIVSQMAVCVYNYQQFTTLNERMGNLENKVDETLVDDIHRNASSNETILDHSKALRERRSVQKSATNLQSLAKRVVVLEKR